MEEGTKGIIESLERLAAFCIERNIQLNPKKSLMFNPPHGHGLILVHFMDHIIHQLFILYLCFILTNPTQNQHRCIILHIFYDPMVILLQLIIFGCFPDQKYHTSIKNYNEIQWYCYEKPYCCTLRVYCTNRDIAPAYLYTYTYNTMN